MKHKIRKQIYIKVDKQHIKQKRKGKVHFAPLYFTSVILAVWPLYFQFQLSSPHFRLSIIVSRNIRVHKSPLGQNIRSVVLGPNYFNATEGSFNMATEMKEYGHIFLHRKDI